MDVSKKGGFQSALFRKGSRIVAMSTGGNGIDLFQNRKMAVPGSKERSQTRSLEFKLPHALVCLVVPPRCQSRQTPALSLAPYSARHHNLTIIDELAYRRALRTVTITPTITTNHFVGNFLQNPNLPSNSAYDKQFTRYVYLN